MTTTRSNPSARKSPASKRRTFVLVATRKGAWIFHGDAARRTWKADGPHFLGHVVSHMVLDPRDGRTLLAAAKTGHLGPTVFRSTNLGRTWKEAVKPPAFTKAADGGGRAVGGSTWQPYSTLNDDPQFREWMGTVQDGTPDGPKLHSVIIDPRDAAHLYIGMSGGGVHESRDSGSTWQTLIGGLDVVEGFGFDPTQPTFHDPHCVRMCPSNPDRLYQQNHCGIYRIDRPSDTWVRIGKNMPKKIGDVGFPLVVHPRDDNTAWVFPMDGTGVWPRTSPAGKPAVYATRNGGKTWQRLAAGMPDKQAWWTVKRQAMCTDAATSVGLYFGTTSGELWASRDEGRRWACIARHLPEIYAVETATL